MKRFFKRAVWVLCAGMFFLVASNAVQGQEFSGVKVEKIEWEADGKTYPHDSDMSLKAPEDGKLTLKMVVSGDAESLQALKSKRKMPLQHKWYKYSGSRLFPMEVKVAMRNSGIKSDENGKWQVECKTTFNSAAPGNYVVKMIYYNREAVRMGKGTADFPIQIE